MIRSKKSYNQLSTYFRTIHGLLFPVSRLLSSGLRALLWYICCLRLILPESEWRDEAFRISSIFKREF